MNGARVLLAAVLAVSANASSGNAQSPPPPIGTGAADWVITDDIPPFTVTWARGRQGGGQLADHWFGRNPGNGGGVARYQDATRHMLVEVRIYRDVRTAYLDFLVEHPYREDTTGRFYEPDTSLITLFGQPVLFYCDTPPNCTDRTYVWRSEESLVVSINSYALKREGAPWGPQVALPCPEPTEILAAYLGRYPSSLTDNWAEPTWEWANSAERRREHVRTQVAIELAAVRYWLAMAGRQPGGEAEADALLWARRHLLEFARERERLLAGPSAREEERRLHAIGQLPLAERMAKLREVAGEYQKWWDDNVGTPIHVPELPAPTPAPGAAPTPPATP